MEVGDEHATQVRDFDSRVREARAERLFGVGRVKAGVDETPAMSALDQISVDDRQTTDGKGNGNAPDARRDEIAQRKRRPRGVTDVRMEFPWPVRLVD
jgi:hypothetical protein